LLYRWLVLYPLYALSEIAIASTDLAELLGSAIALVMIFPSLPLWAGVLITASDVLFLLAMGDPLRGRPVKTFEIIISILVRSDIRYLYDRSFMSLQVFATLICMAIIISRIDVRWGMAFDGFVPSKYVFSSGGLYTCTSLNPILWKIQSNIFSPAVGIIGATVMPHSLFLGSHLATQDRLDRPVPISGVPSPETPLEEKDTGDESRSVYQRLLDYTKAKLRSFVALESLDTYLHPPYKTHAERENRSLAFVKAHLSSGIIDMVISLLGIAVIINAL
jgi:metal iron transporter